MNKKQQHCLRSTADTLISMIAKTVDKADKEETYDSEKLERLTLAFHHSLAAISSLDEGCGTKSVKKAAGQKKAEKEAGGRIILPRVMERDHE